MYAEERWKRADFLCAPASIQNEPFQEQRNPTIGVDFVRLSRRSLFLALTEPLSAVVVLLLPRSPATSSWTERISALQLCVSTPVYNNSSGRLFTFR